MSTENTEMNQVNENEELNLPSELDILKQRAKMMGIQHSPNIGIDALKKKIEEAMNETEQKEEAQTEQVEAKIATASPTMTLRSYLKQEALRLVRVRLVNRDPKKKDIPGEIITAGNEYITVRKFIPFDTQFYEDGYHIPNCIYEFLKAKKYLQIRTVKKRGQKPYTETSYVDEYSIEVLPQLTEAELRKLAAQQRANRSTADD